MIPAPDDVIPVVDGIAACKSESPCWGWEGEGEQCQRPPGHEGPHYFEDGACTLQWEYAPGQDWRLE